MVVVAGVFGVYFVGIGGLAIVACLLLTLLGFEFVCFTVNDCFVGVTVWFSLVCYFPAWFVWVACLCLGQIGGVCWCFIMLYGVLNACV